MSPLESALAEIDRLAVGEDAAVLRATLRGLMTGYDLRWTGQPWRSLATEREFIGPIVNPDTGKASRTYRFGGKIDGLVCDSRIPDVFAPADAIRPLDVFLREHKTTSDSIEDPAGPYWRRLEIDAQINGYMLASWQRGEKLAGTLYDVIRKPLIRPKQVGKGDDKRIETPDEFEARLAADCSDRPEWYFQRKLIHRIDAQLIDFAHELWDTADEIRLANLKGRHTRNTGACMLWNRPCDYLGICSGHDTPDSDHWRRCREHAELPDNGREENLLTHSRIATFKNCRKKHELRYELGLVRSDKEESDSLYFGSLIHATLAAWWDHHPCLGVSNDDCNHREDRQTSRKQPAGDLVAG